MTATLLQAPTISRGHLSLVYSATTVAAPASPLPGRDERNLNSWDMIALHGWMRRPEASGYPRMVIEVGDGSGEPEEGGYALLYEAGQDWASWGIARDSEALVVWHCASGADKGRFPTMQAALASLPVIWRGVSRSRDMAPRLDGRCTVVRLA